MKQLLILFFFISTLFGVDIITQKALDKKLYNLPTFKALLHYKDKFYITDKNFFLSKNHTLKNELIADIKGFKKSPKEYINIDNHPQCVFPARFLFVKKELNISNSYFPKVECKNLKIYEKKAPADKISLVFASENIKSPSSMMGHTFFKYEGKNYAGREVSHAISFYTFINTINPIVLLYENSISGMDGFFILKPYREILNNYLNKENRNLWEFELALSPYQKNIIYYHIWELKNPKMKYYFTSYNCASVVFYILATAKPTILKEDKFWLTPLSVIKIANKNHLIIKSNLLPNDEWFIKLLEKKVLTSDIQDIKNSIKFNNFQKFQNLKINQRNFYKLVLLQTYAIYLLKNKKISKQKFDEIGDILKQYKFPYNIDISKYKTPLKTPPERKIKIGFVKDNRDNFLEIGFLPASHTLNDNNREYFNESELKIGYLSFLLNDKHFLLNKFNIYKMTNLIPYDSLTHPYSSSFDLSIQRDYDEELNKKLFLKTKFAIGEDINIFNDINMFVLLNAELNYNQKTFIKTYPQFGFMMYEIFNSKLYVDYKPTFINNKFAYNEYDIYQNIFLKNDFKVIFGYKKIEKKEEFQVNLVKYF